MEECYDEGGMKRNQDSDDTSEYDSGYDSDKRVTTGFAKTVVTGR